MSEDNGKDQVAGAVTRRNFVIWTGTAAGAAVAAEVLAPLTGARADIGPVPPPVLLGPYVVRVRRPVDQCVLTLQFYNVRPDFTQSPPVMTKVDSDAQNYLVVNFGPPIYGAPQHVAESAYPLATGHLGPSSQHKPVPATKAVHAAPISARIAGPTRLAFHIPDSVLGKTAAHPLTLTSASLLNWVGLTLSVAANAVPPFQRGLGLTPSGLGKPVRPSPTQTAIEMPTGLIISPPASPSWPLPFTSATIFVNSTVPVTHGAWTELWHTRLAVRELIRIGRFEVEGVNENDRAARTIRALWAQDAPFTNDLTANNSDVPDSGFLGFRSSLNYADRYDIVRLSSDFTTSADNGGPYGRTGKGQNTFGFTPQPATVDLLMLSALGGWLDCEAHWDLPKSIGKPSKARQYYDSSLLSWRHRAAQGRDSYVRVVRKGYLFPWGHRASLITVTEREPTQVGTTTGAYLRQKTFIVVSEPEKSYGGGGDFAQFGGRKIPFRTVQAVTLVTPDLNAPKKFSPLQGKASDVFEPTIGPGTKPPAFRFHFRGIDWAGDPISFSSPVLWVDDVIAYADTTARKKLMNDVMTRWGSPTINLHNQRVSVAVPKDPDAPAGDTQIVAANFQLGVEKPDTTNSALLIDASQPAFYPSLHTVSISMPEAKTASGNAVAGSLMEFEHDHYLVNGFTNTKNSANRGGIFLRRVPSATRHAITFRGDKSGGAVTPNLGVDGISREIGPMSAPTDAALAALALGTFNPQSVFDSVNAKLLGGLKLSAILSQVKFGAPDTSDSSDHTNNDQVLTLTSLELQAPHRVVTTLDWHPPIISGGPLPGVDIFVVPGGTSDDSMDLHAVIVTGLEPAAKSTTHVYGQIRDFEIHLFGDGSTGFMVIPFDSLTFRSETGKKTDVDVQIGSGGVQFVGTLSFVQELADYLSFDGSGLVIDTSGDAITAVLTLAIPSLAVGVFGLENLAFSAGVSIPYNGDPVRFDFAFCSRDNPFQLSIMIFTGGGFVGLGIGADGVELLEFSFDFGLGISIDIGIASGQISLVGGVYYESQQLTNGKQEVQLTAYVKASGGISALGIVSVSVELYLSLGYSSDGTTSSLSGTATLTISVHILFFGGSISISMHEDFAGSSTSSSAAQMHSAQRRRALAGATPHVNPAYPVNSFGYTMSETDWEAYCTSFALVGVGV